MMINWVCEWKTIITRPRKMKYWRTKKRKALRVQIVILFILPNAFGKLYLNLNVPNIPKEGHQHPVRARPQVITGGGWPQKFLVWGGKLQMPLRLEQGKNYSAFRSCLPPMAQKATVPSCEVCLFHERWSKRRVVQERASQRCSSQKEEPCHLTVWGGHSLVASADLHSRTLRSGPRGQVRVSMGTLPEATQHRLCRARSHFPTLNHSEWENWSQCFFSRALTLRWLNDFRRDG